MVRYSCLSLYGFVLKLLAGMKGGKTKRWINGQCTILCVRKVPHETSSISPRNRAAASLRRWLNAFVACNKGKKNNTMAIKQFAPPSTNKSPYGHKIIMGINIVYSKIFLFLISCSIIKY